MLWTPMDMGRVMQEAQLERGRRARRTNVRWTWRKGQRYLDVEQR